MLSQDVFVDSNDSVGALWDCIDARNAIGAVGSAGLPAELTAPSGRGSESYNMDPSKDHLGNSSGVAKDQQARAGGLDWLAFSLEIRFLRWDSLVRQLEAARAAAADGGSAKPWSVGGVDVVVDSRGAGRGQSYRKFVFRFGNVSIGVCEQWKAGRPNVFVEFHGDPLLKFGVPALMAELDSLLCAWDGRYVRSWVSRVDYCVDVVGLEIKDVLRDFFGGRCIGLASDFSVYGKWLDRDKAGLGIDDGGMVAECRGFQTLNVGAAGGSCRMRIYDKLAQVQGRGEKVALMLAKVWGGVMPDSCTRVEFQLRREKLVSLNVSTLEDLFGSVERVCDYLTHGWFRVADSDFDRRNTNRVQSGGWWLGVREQFRGAARAVFEKLPEVKLVKTGTNAAKMLQQAVGCLQRLCAELGNVPDSPAGIVALVGGAIAENFSGFREGVVEKIERVEGLTLEQLCAYFDEVGDLGELRLMRESCQGSVA